MSDFYRVACGDTTVWFDSERDAKQYFKDRANDDDQDACHGSTDSIAAVLAELSRLEKETHLRRILSYEQRNQVPEVKTKQIKFEEQLRDVQEAINLLVHS